MQKLFLLGDIFDFFIGSYPEYLTLYPQFFSFLRQLKHSPIKCHYFEGNHDFHLKQFFLNSGLHHIHLHPAQIEMHDPGTGARFYISHGDELELDNHAYQRYKKIIRSPFCEMLSQEVISFQTVTAIKNWLAKKSKEAQKDFQWERRRDLYRGYAKALWERGYQHVVIGHNHVKDELHCKIDGRWHTYHNLGYFPRDQQALVYQEGQFYWRALNPF